MARHITVQIKKTTVGHAIKFDERKNPLDKLPDQQIITTLQQD